MEEIARHAGINKALLHYYFRSKEKLYQVIFQREFKRIIGDLSDSISPELNTSQFLQSFINTYIERIRQNPHVIQFMLWEIRSGGENVRKILQQVYSSGESIFTPHIVIERLKQAIKKGEIRRTDPHQLLLSIISMCIYTFVAVPIIEAIFPEIKPLDDTFIRRRKTEIFQLVWRGIKP